MKKNMLMLLALVLIFSVFAAACGSKPGAGTTNNAAGGAAGKEEPKKALKIGATAGPYSDMVSKAIKPLMEKKGYTIEVVEFNDYVQPNKALASGSLNANLFQHVLYLKKFAEDNKLDLKEVISVPTAPMGLYSKKFKSLNDIKEGSALTISNDAANLYRSLLLLQDIGLVKMKKDADPAKASEKDIEENPKKLNIKPLEAAQLPRTVDSSDLALVPGNFALAAKMDLTSALKLENMAENYRNVLVVNTKDIDSQMAKDLKETIQSKDFEKIMDEQFKGFSKPQWMTGK
ncbi:MetQ/NlpA family ABC transporter substrate-binding protein [Paenibacillus allorhizosphaerae]|uniref:Lipoprotein n=1 Tax=Paenibacillus allorhizosphaerae TaxID=2849866 RepID=A0ABM8VJM1_9BACL|nr:MetQ/NlpA family ABC transporter substrate-binding protein [Paenibacillus allorhizosphaerae]CAG7645368.1 D-methionine-binding lipoprotein MetQ [Paenibacillus allorhizosphaerae]